MNRAVVLTRRPVGPVTEDHFEIIERPDPEPAPGEVAVRTLVLSCDPYLRGLMGTTFTPGGPITARAVGQVTASRHPRWKVGDLVWGFLSWQEHVVVEGGALYPVDATLGPISRFISVLGMPGLTAWVGMVEVGRPAPGDQVLVSAAAGAVGSLAGQLARLAGAHVVGTVGSPTKAAHVIERLGYHEVIDHRAADDLAAEVATAFPRGIDVYFDNVGGPLLEAVLANLAPFARIASCGMISAYERLDDPGIRGLMGLMRARATMTGFTVGDHVHRIAAYQQRLAAMLDRGEVVYDEDIWDGIDVLPAAFVGMLGGDNTGKRLVRVGEPA